MLGKFGFAVLAPALLFAQDRARNLQAFPRDEIANARKLALVCAVDEYDEGAALRRLDYAEKDAADLC